MRHTSIATFHSIRESGLLSRKRLEVLEIIAFHGPLTAHEIVDIGRKSNPYANQTGWNARLSELEAMGVIETVGFKLNPISRQKNLIWEMTGRNPKPFKRPESSREKIQRLEDEIINLQKQIKELEECLSKKEPAKKPSQETSAKWSDQAIQLSKQLLLL